MKNTILGGPDHISHLPHHGFNMSQNFAFTSSVGMLLPMMYDILNPGEKVSLDFQLETLSSNAAMKAPMCDIDEHIDLFFIPFSKIFTPSLQILMNVDDLSSTAFNKNYLTSGSVIPALRPNEFDAAVQSLITSMVPDGLDNVNMRSVLDDFYGRQRLLEHLGYNLGLMYSAVNGQQWLSNDQLYSATVSPALLAAYQAVYYDYYRLSDFEANDLDAYNLDQFGNVSTFRVSSAVVLNSLTKLRYRPYRRDYFKLIERSPLQGSLGVLNNTSVSNSQINQWLLSSGGYFQQSPASSGLQSDLNTPSSIGPVNSPQSTNTATLLQVNAYDNTVALRTAFAFERLLRISNRAGKHYDDQVAAHFGFKPSNAYSNEVIFIGSRHQKLVFKPVVSTAETDTGNIGQLAARGVGMPHKDRQNMKFTAPCHGILMAIYSSSPNVYYQTGLDKVNTMLNQYDFFVPEFDKLGMQPLFYYEFAPSTSYATNRRGWQYRYQHLKLKYDRTTCAFTEHANEIFNNTAPQGLQGEVVVGGAFYPYLITGNRLRMTQSNIKDYLYVSPYDVNPLMTISYNPSVGVDFAHLWSDEWDSQAGAWNDENNVLAYLYAAHATIYSTDPFINNCHIEYFKSSPMSTFGEPEI